MVTTKMRGLLLATASALLLASCGGSSDSSGARNAALSDAPPTITTIELPAMTLPLNIAVGSDGSVYTVNIVNRNLIKISPDGTVNATFATIGGDQYGIDIDAAGNIYSVGLSNSKVTKVTPAGAIAYSEWVDHRPIALVAADDGTVYTANQSSKTVSRISPSGEVTKQWAVVPGVPSGIDIDAKGNVVVSLGTANKIVRIAQDGSQEKFDVGTDPTDLEVAPNGDIYVVNRVSKNISVIGLTGNIRTIELDAYNLTGIAIDKAGYVYVVDDGGSRVSRIGLDDSVITTWAQAGGQSHKVAVGPDGTVYTANLSGNSVTKIVPAPVTPSAEDTTPAELKAALVPTFDAVTRTANGFSVAITNYDPEWTYEVVASSIGSAELASDGLITVSGLFGGIEEMITVTTTRVGYESGSAMVSGQALDAAPAEPAADPQDATPTQDTTGTAGSTPSNTDSTIASMPASTDPVPSDTTPAASVPATGDITPTESTPAGSGSTPTDSSLALPNSTPASTDAVDGQVPVSVGDIAQVIAIGDEVVVAVPPAAVSRAVSNAMSENPAAPTPILVNTETTEIACTATCVQAMLASVGATEGEVIATIGDAQPVTITAAAPALLKVGKKDATIRFTIKPKGGKDVVVDIPVVHSDSVPEVKAASGGSSDSNSSTLIVLVALILVALAIGGYVMRRRASSTPDSSQSA